MRRGGKEKWVGKERRRRVRRVGGYRGGGREGRRNVLVGIFSSDVHMPITN